MQILVAQVLVGQEEVVSKDNGEKPKEILLNFENASLAHVLNYLAEHKKINLISHKDLEAQQVTLITNKPQSVEKAWDVLLTLLEANNFTIINVDGLYRVVQTTTSRQQPLPSFAGIEPEKLPDNDKMIRFIYFLTNIKADQVKRILDQMLAPNSVQLNAASNALIISEKSLTIKSVMQIIKNLDLGGLQESLDILKLDYVSASYVAKIYNENLLGKTRGQPLRLFPPQEKKPISFFSSSTKIIAEPRTNTLILLGTRKNLDRIRTFTKKYFDQPLESPVSRLHVKELKYTDAEQISPLLKAAIQPPGKAAKVPVIGGVKYFEDMIIAAESSIEGQGDKSMTVGAGNRLIITCNQDDWKRIEQFIDKLDRPTPQVAMEVLFIDAEIDTNKQLGSQVRNKNQDSLVKGLNFQTQHLNAIPDTGLVGVPGGEVDFAPELQNNLIFIPAAQASDGASWLTVGKTAADKVGGIWGVAKSVLQTNNLNIISQPFLVANNRKKSILKLDDRRRVAGPIDPSSTTAVQAVETIHAETTVELTPGINSVGIINLLIQINLDEFSEITTSGVADRLKRQISTRTLMSDGEVLVIGGLIQNTDIETIRKTPILGDIPILGNLFRSRIKLNEKKDLYIFIRPSIIKPRFEGKPDDYTQLKLDYANLSINRAVRGTSTKDPIQHWFFDGTSRPESTLVARATDPIEQVRSYTEAKQQPKSVNIIQDPYYKTKTSRTIVAREKEKERIGKELKTLKKRKRRVGDT